MDIQELRDKTSHLKTVKQMFVNETFMWVNLARESVNKLPNTNFEFNVPKAKHPQIMKSISRKKPLEVKERIVTKDIYNSAFVSMVASIEDYLFKICELILSYDNNRIKYNLQQLNTSNNVSVIDLIDYNKEELIKKIINEKLIALFYAGPQIQIKYFEKALDINIEKEIWDTWTEIKARRDIIVHNNGIINETYLDKTKSTNLSLLNTEILISDEYFANAVSFFKSMAGQIDKKIRDYYK